MCHKPTEQLGVPGSIGAKAIPRLEQHLVVHAGSLLAQLLAVLLLRQAVVVQPVLPVLLRSELPFAASSSVLLLVAPRLRLCTTAMFGAAHNAHLPHATTSCVWSKAQRDGMYAERNGLDLGDCATCELACHAFIHWPLEAAEVAARANCWQRVYTASDRSHHHHDAAHAQDQRQECRYM